MPPNDRIAQASSFRELHVPGRPLVLFNVWDAGSAREVAARGAARHRMVHYGRLGAEHERMHARATRTDQTLHAAANAFDIDGHPRVSHLLPLKDGP